MSDQEVDENFTGSSLLIHGSFAEYLRTHNLVNTAQQLNLMVLVVKQFT